MPPIKNTTILEPLQETKKTICSIATTILAKIQKTTYNNTFTFENFIDELGINEDDYIMALISTINRLTFYLKIKP